MELMKSVIASLVARLRIDTGSAVTTVILKEMVRRILLGEADKKTVVVDVPYQLRRIVILGPLSFGDFSLQEIPKNPLIVDLNIVEVDGFWVQSPSPVAQKKIKEEFSGRQIGLATAEVAGFFRGRSRKTEAPFPLSWACGAVSSFAKISIGGDLPPVEKETKDPDCESNWYQWFDLDKVPIEGSVYRISCNETLWLFTKVDNDNWEVTVQAPVTWAKTSHDDGALDFRALLEGANTAFEIYQKEMLENWIPVDLVNPGE